MTSSVGIDVGGTFTDLVAVDRNGSISAGKVATTARDQSEGVEHALREPGSAEDVHRIIHGTTVATNMLLERSGARVVLCVTEGIADLLELRRQDRASLYDLALHHPSPLVPHDRIVAVRERMEPGGITRALTAAESHRVAEAVATLEPEAVAIVLLHAYANPDHERALAEILRSRLPGIDVVVSSDIHPEIREYERASTTAAEVYLRKGVARYLERLTHRLRELNLPMPGVLLSSGGMQPATRAAHNAAGLALSGPAGGVIGAAAIARQADIPQALSIDIGGTSADVGLIVDGLPFVDAGGSIAGVPIALPRVLVETVSAGGGSIGWIDSAGVLRTGPRSAGMTPGPAAFGRGGVEPTVTDAHVVLGNISSGRLSGAVSIDADAAHRSLMTLATPLSTTAERVAAAMIAIADAEMARALRRLSVDRGIDPRHAVLIPFGGGGPLHACGLAERMGMSRVLVPPHAGVLSALGLAIAAEHRTAVRSVMRSASMCDESFVQSVLTALSSQVRSDGATDDAVYSWWARCRYQGQGHELEQAVRPGDAGADVAAGFAATHALRYGFTLERDVQIVSMRCVAETAGRSLTFRSSGFEAERRTIRGRATLVLPDATMLVAEHWTATPHASGGWMMERDA